MEPAVFAEYEHPQLAARTHKHSLNTPEPPPCGRSSPCHDVRTAHWSSHGHIRFRRDGVDDPAMRRESFPAAPLAPQRTRAPWGVPEEALLQQRFGGRTARRGYLTSVILGTAPEGSAHPTKWRRSKALQVTGATRDPIDEAAVRLAFLGVPWQYAYCGIEPAARPSTPDGSGEAEKPQAVLHGARPYRVQYDPGSKTHKRIYYVPPEPTCVCDDEPQAPYSIVPGVRRAKPLPRDQGPRPPPYSPPPHLSEARSGVRRAWDAGDQEARDGADARVNGSVWGGTDLGPRLPIDDILSVGRAHFLDRSLLFARIMERLDELERLARLTPIEGRELRALCLRENEELLVLHRAYAESVQDGIFVLRCRELLEDLMPVCFGYASRNSEAQRIEAAKNLERRHNDLRYRGIGH